MGKISIPQSELQFSAIRAAGPGGQHVNKVSTAVELRFDINGSSLSGTRKQRLLAYRDRRISEEGVVVIKAQRFRSQDRNRQDALERLYALIEKALAVPKPRLATRPGRAAKERRLKEKRANAQRKNRRGKPGSGEFDS